MITPIQHETNGKRLSKVYPNMKHCVHCDALYAANQKWVKGYYHGTSSEFITTQIVKDEHCPICGKKEQK